MSRPGLRFEVCVETLEGVRAAAAAGADRIELCADLAVDGLTPPPDLVAAAVDEAAGRLAVHVLIRVRAGDFVYDDAEIERMGHDAVAARRAGASGLVIGALTRSATIDERATSALVEAARPASVTFHRAFDRAADLSAALEILAALGADRVLTSGGAPDVLAGATTLAALRRQAGSRLTILPGGGVTEGNVAELLARTGATELHFSARATTPGDARSHGQRIRAIMAAARAP